jgi:translocation and assembly module TamA
LNVLAGGAPADQFNTMPGAPSCTARSALAFLLLTTPCQAQTVRLRAELQGLDGELRANALAVAGIFSAARSRSVVVSRIERLHARAPEEIQLALHPYGFYRATVRAELSRDARTWTARYQVDPGPPLLLSRVSIRLSGEGESDPAFLEAVRSFPLAPGDTLRQPRYERGKLALAEIAARRGYLKAQFDTSEIRIDLEAYTAEIVLHLETGPQYLFGPVSFNQDLVDPRLLRGYVKFQPGDTFDIGKLLETQRGLASSSLFSQVDVRPDTAAAGREVPIQVDLVPRKRHSYEFGIGYGTDTGVRGSIEADFRRLNRRGHNATVRFEASQIRRTLSAQYRFPPVYPETANYAIVVGGGDFSPTWSTSLRATLGVSRSQLRGPLNEVLSLSFEAQDFTIAEQDGTSYLLIPGASWAWTWSDDRARPLHGVRVQFEISGSLDGLGANTSYLQTILSGGFIRGLGSRLRFLSRAKIGRTYYEDFNQLPPTLRFVTGGDRTVRGYSYETLGPRDAEDRLVGGDLLVEASAEADYLLIGKWSLAIFFDVGNGLESLGDLSLAKGAGAGVRWLTPVGPIRLDVAYGFDAPSEDVRIHLTLGPDI